MNDDLRDRREETYRMLVAHGLRQSEVVARLSEDYGVTKNAIRKDINQMPSWLPELSIDFGAGIIRLTRLRDQQQQLERLAMEASREGNLNAAVGARREIRKAIMSEEQIAVRMGLAPEGEADDGEWTDELAAGLDPENEALLDAFTGPPPDPDPLTVDEDGTLVLEGDAAGEGEGEDG